MNKRNWTSLVTPESFRKCLMAWEWAKTWWEFPLFMRPAFGRGQLSLLVPMLQIIQRKVLHPDDGMPVLDSDGMPILSTPWMCLEQYKWGALTLDLKRLDNNDAWQLYGLTDKVSYLHIWDDPEKYQVLPHTACSPLESQLHHPNVYENKVFIRQTGPAIPLLQWVFSHKVTLSWGELQFLAEQLELRHRGSNRDELLVLITRHAFREKSVEEIDAAVTRMLKADKQVAAKMKVSLIMSKRGLRI